ncbi:MAG: hypothetical protein DWQ36_11320 [Acidobacteria bacterium]|nr:MAG: hypothetical protein DWQ30_12080 [Acidobacteriota bacterium]REK07796.1 MAG: hypothetical protein DWQ36_11320 [Acidobacteriota bacterium]
MLGAFLVAAVPAFATTPTDKDEKAEKQDEWHIELSDHWRNSIDEDDERALGYVTTVDHPTFTLRTHDEGTMTFVIPETTEFADDILTGNRVQVWYDPNDFITGVDGASWLIVHGFGIHPVDVEANEKMAMDRSQKHSQSAERSKDWRRDAPETDDPRAVQNAALSTRSKPGPGPNAYTLMGTITEVKESAIVLDTVVGPRVVRLLPQTETVTELEMGKQVAVDFHRGGTFIHAKVIRSAQDS